MKEKYTIIKLQKAINNDNVLAYNKDRSIMGEFPITEELRLLFGNRLKIYCKCKYKTGGLLEIEKEVKHQNW